MFLLPCLVICLTGYWARGGESDGSVNKARSVVKENAALLDGIGQLLVVFNETPESNSATLLAMEKKDNKWVAASASIAVGIGRNGFAAPNEKREGDHKSPTGVFRLGQLFCYEKEVNTRMPFIQTTRDDKWIDDPNSSDYNRYVRGTTQAGSFENLKINSDEYKYCMAIEYNMNPVVKGMGSAIFLHLSIGDVPNSSSGCVVVTLKDMEWLLRWMNPELKPSIIMGNEQILISGLK